MSFFFLTRSKSQKKSSCHNIMCVGVCGNIHSTRTETNLPRANDNNALLDPPERSMASKTPIDSSIVSPLLSVTKADSSLGSLGLANRNSIGNSLLLCNLSKGETERHNPSWKTVSVYLVEGEVQ